MRFLAAFLVFASLASVAANGPRPDFRRLQSYVQSWSLVDGIATDGRTLLTLIRKLEQKQQKSGNTTAFVIYLFERTRHQFLRNYTEYATFSETLASGTYNCLTGTAVYALLLEHFGIPYQLVETSYHIFLIAEVDDERILLETTDAERGFVKGNDYIDARIREHRQALPNETNRSKSYYQYNADLYNQVSLDELTGLLYYNRAIVAYNNQDLSTAIEKFTKSVTLYQSARMAEFAAILQITVAESALDITLKQQYLRKIQQLRANAVSFSASNRE